MARTTIRDIARATGLSITAVSLVLNEKPHRISEENCELIRSTAKKMHYRPNRLAVGLIKKMTHTIGLIVPDISNSFFSEITKTIEDMLIKQSFNLLLCNSNDRSDYERECVNMLADNSVDGLLFVMSSGTHGSERDLTLEELHYAGVPTVVIDCAEPLPDFDTVATDNEGAAFEATEHLIALGHERIACVTGDLKSPTSRTRLFGYRQALEKHGIPFDEKLIYADNFYYQTGYDSVAALLPQRPTAILCFNDMIAYGVMHALRQKEIAIPQEISVVGFDDIFFSHLTGIPLTTIHQPMREIGSTAVSLLLDKINGKKKEIENIKLPAHLIVRRTTACPHK